MTVWYIVQKDGSVRFMESKELCELDRAFSNDQPRKIASYNSQIDSSIVATIESEIERVKTAQSWSPYTVQENCKLTALKALKIKRDIVEKVFKIRTPKGGLILNARVIEECLTQGIYLKYKLTVEEVEQ